jgi:hypothetical protein
MNVILLPLVLTMYGSGLSGLPSTSSPSCPAQTETGRRLVTDYAGSDRNAEVRERKHLPRIAGDRVRVLAGERDTLLCERLMAALRQRAEAVGGTLSGSAPEFYAVGAHYYAVLPQPPSRCKPGPRHACVDLRSHSLDVFDRDLNLVASSRL